MPNEIGPDGEKMYVRSLKDQAYAPQSWWKKAVQAAGNVIGYIPEKQQKRMLEQGNFNGTMRLKDLPYFEIIGLVDEKTGQITNLPAIDHKDGFTLADLFRERINKCEEGFKQHCALKTDEVPIKIQKISGKLFIISIVCLRCQFVIKVTGDPELHGVEGKDKL